MITQVKPLPMPKDICFFDKTFDKVLKNRPCPKCFECSCGDKNCVNNQGGVRTCDR